MDDAVNRFTMKKQLLMIEDEIELAGAVTYALESADLEITHATTLTEAMKRINEKQFSLILVDLHLPDGSGMEFIPALRINELNRHTPILIMTGDSELDRKVSAFAQGVEDYIVKPFHLLELRARVERRMAKQSEFETLVAGPVKLNLQTQTVELQGLKGPIYLTPREFKILHLLAKNPKITHSRDTILKKIWGDGIHVTNRTVDAHICYLRKKLEGYGNLIRSSAGEGYRFHG
jgi:DNA-binding response OmpR family regulator